MSSQSRRFTVRFNLFSLKRQLEIANDRKYTWVEVADGSGLNRKTVERMALNQYRRVDLSTLEGLISFFTNEGMSVDISDLFTLTPGSHQDTDTQEE
jgi:hypothetical protein